MPTYAYKCSKCQEEFEVVQRVTDAPLTHCTARYEDGGTCTGSVTRLIPSGRVGGFVLNGGGWAKDGY